MARRPSVASLDSGMESPDYGGGSPMAGRGVPAAKPLRSGSCGRWLPWPMRVLPWAAILIVGYRGVSSIMRNERPSTASAGNGAAAASAPSFPVMLAAYSLQFGQVYLNSSPGNATERANELAKFIPANVGALQPEFGWTGAGTMQLQSEQVAGIDVRSAHTAVVVVIATIIGRLAELGAPVYASGSGVVVPGEPSWLSAPTAASLPDSPRAASGPAAQRALPGGVPAFFRAYAGGGQATLNCFLALGASVGGLGGAVGFVSIASLTVPPGGATRGIAVTVSWVLYGQVSQAAPQLPATYKLVVIDRPGGRWYVREIRASTQPMGTQ
jgi:Conjugative transposon protein TcpC